MNICKKCYFYSIFIIACHLTSCAKYTPHPYKIPKQNNSSKIQIDSNQIIVRAQTLSEADCKYYFSRKVLNKNYRPIQIYIQNNTYHSFTFAPKNINMQIEPVYYAAKKLHLNETQRFVTWAIPGLFLWPFLIPALVDALCANDANTELNDDFHQRVIGPDGYVVIKPNSQMNKVMFVTCENFSHKLQIKLLNQDTREILEYTFYT